MYWYEGMKVEKKVVYLPIPQRHSFKINLIMISIQQCTRSSKHEITKRQFTNPWLILWLPEKMEINMSQKKFQNRKKYHKEILNQTCQQPIEILDKIFHEKTLVQITSEEICLDTCADTWQ